MIERPYDANYTRCAALRKLGENQITGQLKGNAMALMAFDEFLRGQRPVAIRRVARVTPVNREKRMGGS